MSSVLDQITVHVDGIAITVERLEDGTFRKPDYLIQAERQVIGHEVYRKQPTHHNGASINIAPVDDNKNNREWDITAPATDLAKKYSGYGSALKPACEEWILVRKPLAEKSIAAQVLATGTGAINIDISRVGTNGETWAGNEANAHENYSADVYGKFGKQYAKPSNPQGRFPSHLLLSHSLLCVPLGEKRVRSSSRGFADTDVSRKGIYDLGSEERQVTAYQDAEGMETVEAFECSPDCPIRLLDQQSGVRKNGGPNYPGGDRSSMFGNTKVINPTQYAGDKGGASRYFQNFHPDDMPPFLYTSKASRAERSKGCEALPERAAGVKNASGRGFSESDPYRDIKATNNHPTVKPVNLLTYLIRMITPPNGIVLDMFAGSGTTGVAAVQCGFRYILVEQEQEYIDIIHARLAHAHGAAPQEAHSILRETIRRVRTDMEDCTHDWVDLPKESQFKAYCKLCDAFKSVEAQEVEYECAEDCPVRVLGEQSGVRKSGGRVSHVGDVTEREHIYHSHTSQREYEMQGSTGTAARFFQTFPPGSLFEGMEDVNGEQESEQERVT